MLSNINAWQKNELMRITLGLLLVLVGLTGCGSRDMTDLDSYMQEIRKKKAPDIEPPPTFSQYEAFIYGAAGLRSPFEKPQAIAEMDPGRRRGEMWS